ncbi:MAG: tRNA (adenosine(37)-N6)-threonylcarbamoyltransferase complex transferase subunit TsaD [Bacteroidota bacterium]
MNILAIESSCDDTSAAVITDGKIRSNIVANQAIHQKWGGVVPELASRAHQQYIVAVVNEAIAVANIQKSELNAVAFTRGPGLLGSLLVGTSFAKSFALGLNIPLIEVNHMQAHVLAHFIEEPRPNFPFLCLTVSGGHTQIVKVNSALDMEIVGETQDDAVGEAFDKAAKLLGFEYPGGPFIDKFAANGDPLKYKFPIGEMPELSYSFSGIKTSFLYFLQKEIKANENFVEQNREDICASMQYTLIEILLKKLKLASKKFKIKNIAIAGGVSANSGLRKALNKVGQELDWQVFIPKFEYCTDNAAMIAMAAHFKAEAGIFAKNNISPMPRLSWNIYKND